jgi:hypothetical protein
MSPLSQLFRKSIIALSVLIGTTAFADVEFPEVTQCLDNEALETSAVQVWLYSKATGDSDIPVRKAIVYRLNGSEQKSVFEAYSRVMQDQRGGRYPTLVAFPEAGSAKSFKITMKMGFGFDVLEATDSAGAPLDSASLTCKVISIHPAQYNSLP